MSNHPASHLRPVERIRERARASVATPGPGAEMQAGGAWGGFEVEEEKARGPEWRLGPGEAAGGPPRSEASCGMG